MHELDFRDLISSLVDWRLISYDKTKNTYTTHPLIKGYFESTFDEKIKKLCHKHIYQYFGLYTLEWPETLDEMQPLFEQVYHGCAAGLYDEVLYDVYWEKINRKDEYFITHNFDAWETALSLTRTFFPEGDLSQMPLVSKTNSQGWLLNAAGLALLITGRPKEAEELFLTAVLVDIEAKDWKNASTGYENLADLQFRSGELESGLESAKKALDAAEKAESDEYIKTSKVHFAWILHLLGKGEKAEKEFRKADALEGKISGYRLYSGGGVFYADLLLSITSIDEAFEITKQNLEICQRNNWPGDISRCHRCLGAIERIRGNHKVAEIHLQNALELARKVGIPDLEIETLLEFGRLHLDRGRYEDAVNACQAVLKLCERTGFKLYEKAIGMKYRWQEGDAAHLLGEIYLAEGDNVRAREWLKKAVACRKEILDPEVKESEMMLEGL
jgi:tetratricopeptide (TPR) repeat protein